MQPEEFVVSALKALAEEDCDKESPQNVEAHVLHAFRRKQTRRRTLNRLGWSLAVAAVTTVVFLAGVRQGTKAPQYVPPPQRVAIRPPQLAVADPPPVKVSAPRISPLEPQAVPPEKSQPREVVTQFFPLLDVAPPFERGELVRVTVPASTMRRVGLPVNENRLGERVYADVLVGEEGLARAIRFVSFEQ